LFDIIEDEGTWYLLVKKSQRKEDADKEGNVIVRHATIGDKHAFLNFPNKTRAKKCAQDLNKKYWKVYKDRFENVHSLGTIANDMVALIEAHIEGTV
jgi:hypothetical protein